ncbi:MAG: twin-arginine translocase subunit TatB [Pseudomonadales bacterium]|nr:twin-arginine translocase subunit TatB [Pseudomonadales bacterium]
MFDIGFTELMLLGIIGLVVIGPQKLPHTIRMIAAYTGRIKRTVNDLKQELEQEVDAQEIRQRIQQEIEDSGLQQLKQEIESSVEGIKRESSSLLDTDTAESTRSEPASPPKTKPLPSNE